jgi:hypothetical protein
MSLFSGSGAAGLGRRVIRFGFRFDRFLFFGAEGSDSEISSSVVSTVGMTGDNVMLGVTGLLDADFEY